MNIIQSVVRVFSNNCWKYCSYNERYV